MDLGGFLTELRTTDTYKYLGKIEKIVGMTIEASGPLCSIGDVCRIYTKDMKSHIPAEVVGFNEHKVLLMPYTDLEGIGPGSIVDNTGDKLNVRVGDKLIGRIIDALGNPLDDGEPIEYTDTVPIAGIPVNPLTRPKIHEPIELGVKAIDGLLTMGKGQRMGIFAGSGVGKSTLMGMIARKVKADLNVIALVGERGREVREFIENDLGEEGMARSVVVVATSDQPAMMRNKCPMTATAIAEYFCSHIASSNSNSNTTSCVSGSTSVTRAPRLPLLSTLLIPGQINLLPVCSKYCTPERAGVKYAAPRSFPYCQTWRTVRFTSSTSYSMPQV